MASLPQTPQRRVRSSTQSGPSGRGSGISRSWIGASGPTQALAVNVDSNFVATRRSSLFSKIRACMLLRATL